MQLISNHQNFLLYCCWGVEPVRPAGECLLGRFCPGLRWSCRLFAACSDPTPASHHLIHNWDAHIFAKVRPLSVWNNLIALSFSCVEGGIKFPGSHSGSQDCSAFLKSSIQERQSARAASVRGVLQWGRAWVSWLLMTASWRAGCGQLRRRLLPLPTVRKHFKRIVWDLVGESDLSFISRQDGFASATVCLTLVMLLGVARLQVVAAHTPPEQLAHLESKRWRESREPYLTNKRVDLKPQKPT